MPKGHSCNLTVALLASNCGPFPTSKSPNGKIEVAFRCSKTDFPIYFKHFHGSVFVKVIKVFTDLTPFKLQMSLAQNPVPAR